ncbi:MAG: hypothetical protein ABJD13_15295 [Paracoccaceae bacterium]
MTIKHNKKKAVSGTKRSVVFADDLLQPKAVIQALKVYDRFVRIAAAHPSV